MGKLILEDLNYITPVGYGIIYKYSFENKLYIGQTRRNLMERHRHHLHNKNIPFDNFIVKYNLLPEIIAIVPVNELNLLEARYIKEYNTLYPNGWNFTSGGDSPEVCPNVFSEEVRKHMSVAHKNHIPINAKTVYQYNLKGEYLAEYHSFMEAGRAVAPDKEGAGLNIAAMIRKGGQSSYGYMWSLTKQDSLPPFQPIKRPNKCTMLGKHHSTETKAKMSMARKKYCSTHPNLRKGTKLSEEVKHRISESEKRTKSKRYV